MAQAKSKLSAVPNAPSRDLGTFDGQEVISTAVKITNAGDGLSSALAVEPQIMHHRQIVTVVLECEVARVSFDPVKDTDRLTRVHTLRTGIATIVDPSLVKKVLEQQRVKLETAAGVTRLPGIDDPDADPGEGGDD